MGKRGEAWVALQLVIFALILLAPRVSQYPFPDWLRGLGLVFLLAGGMVGTMGVLSLGPSLSAFPKPKEGASLVTSGIYQFVRHPIYSGLILGSFGWALLTDSLLGVPLAFILLIFFDLKSRREERWLAETYPGYLGYARRVHKLIPWLY